MFCSNFSWVCMFWDDNISKLVPEYTLPTLSWMIVDNLHKKPKRWHLPLERRVFVLLIKTQWEIKMADKFPQHIWITMITWWLYDNKCV